MRTKFQLLKRLMPLGVFFFGSIFILSCAGPDWGELFVKKTQSEQTSNINCVFCDNLPSIIAPQQAGNVTAITVNDSKAKLEITDFGATTCRYRINYNSTSLEVFAVNIFTPSTPWQINTLISWDVTCYNSASTSTADVSQTSAGSFTVSLDPVQILKPMANYATSGHIILLEAQNNSVATQYLFDIYKGASLMLSTTSSINTSKATLPNGSTGSYSVKLKVIDANGVISPASTSVAFSIRDYANANLKFNYNFSTYANSCAASIIHLLADGCTSNPFYSPTACSSVPWTIKNGNKMVCGQDLGGDYMAINHTGTGYSGDVVKENNNNNSLDLTSTWNGHIQSSSGSNEAILMSCRLVSNDYYSLMVHPYYDGAITENVYLKRFDSNAMTFIELAKAKVPAINNLGSSSASLGIFRFDCIGSNLTGYYKDVNGDFQPMITTQDNTISTTGDFALGTGPAVSNTDMRTKTVTLKSY